MAGLRGTGPAGPARSAAAAGHGIVNEPDDIVANERPELPGGDLHGPSKVILVNQLHSAESGPAAQRQIMRRCSRDRHRVVADAGPGGSVA